MKKLRIFDSLKFVRAMFVAVACTFILNVARAATLPAGYTELEYLQTDGNSWIDTGIKGDMSYKYEIDFQQLDAGQYRNWGAFDQSGYSGGPNMSLTHLSGFAVRWTVSGNNSQAVNLSTLDSNRHHIIIDNGYITWDGVNKGRSTGHQDNYVFGYNLFLGTVNPGGNTPTSNAKSKYYSYKVWNTSGDLIQDLIPAKNSSGVVGMYDMVSGQFFTNAGTGTFIAGEYKIKIATTHYNETKFAPVETRLDAAVAAVDTVVTQTMNQAQAIDQIATSKQTRPDEGCTAKYCLLVEDEDGTPHWYPIAGANGVEYVLPAGYTQLTYIQSDGSQMINTGYVLQETDSVEVDYKLTDLTRTNDKFILGAQPVSGASGYFWVETYNDANNWYVRYGSGTSANTYGSVTPTSQLSGTLAVSKNSFVVNGVEILTPDFVSMPTNPMTIFNRISLDGSIANNGASAQISEVRVKNGNNLVHRYIAVRNSNNELGMYDLMDSNPATAFYTNAGTGTFTAGPDM